MISGCAIISQNITARQGNDAWVVSCDEGAIGYFLKGCCPRQLKRMVRAIDFLCFEEEFVDRTGVTPIRRLGKLSEGETKYLKALVYTAIRRRGRIAYKIRELIERSA